MKSKLTLFTFLIHIPGLVEHESFKKILITNIDNIWSKCNIKKLKKRSYFVYNKKMLL